MRITGKLIGYVEKCEIAPDGTVTSREQLDSDAMAKAVAERPTVVIEVEEKNSSVMLKHIIDTLADWSQCLFLATLLMALSIIEGEPLAEGDANTIIAVITKTLCLITHIIHIVTKADMFFIGKQGWWRIGGRIAGFAAGIFLLDGLIRFVDLLSVKGFLIAWFWFAGVRTAVAVMKEFMR